MHVSTFDGVFVGEFIMVFLSSDLAMYMRFYLLQGSLECKRDKLLFSNSDSAFYLK